MLCSDWKNRLYFILRTFYSRLIFLISPKESRCYCYYILLPFHSPPSCSQTIIGNVHLTSDDWSNYEGFFRSLWIRLWVQCKKKLWFSFYYILIWSKTNVSDVLSLDELITGASNQYFRLKFEHKALTLTNFLMYIYNSLSSLISDMPLATSCTRMPLTLTMEWRIVLTVLKGTSFAWVLHQAEG